MDFSGLCLGHIMRYDEVLEAKNEMTEVLSSLERNKHDTNDLLLTGPTVI